MVPAERDLEVVVLLKPDDTALHFDVEARSRGRTHSRVSAGGQAYFAKNSHFLREIGVEVQDELALVKSAFGSSLIGGCKIKVAKAGDLEGRIG